MKSFNAFRLCSCRDARADLNLQAGDPGARGADPALPSDRLCHGDRAGQDPLGCGRGVRDAGRAFPLA